MAITYFRCTNLDENTAKIILYDKDGKIIPVEKDVSGEAQVDFNLSELITEEGTYNLYVKAYPAADNTEYLESPASESKEYIVGSSGDSESGGTAPDEPEQDETIKYTFTVKPSLSDTTDTTTVITVTLEADGYEKVTGTGSQSIEVISGTIVKYTVSATGYIAQTGEYTVTKSEEYSIELIKEIDDDNWVEITSPNAWQTGFVDIDPTYEQFPQLVQESWDDYDYKYQIVDVRDCTKVKIVISETDANEIGYMTCDANGIYDGYEYQLYSDSTSFTIDFIDNDINYLALTTNDKLNAKVFKYIP